MVMGANEYLPSHNRQGRVFMLAPGKYTFGMTPKNGEKLTWEGIMEQAKFPASMSSDASSGSRRRIGSTYKGAPSKVSRTGYYLVI